MSNEAYTDEEVADFGAALEEWCSTLSPRQQGLLGELVARAGQADDEVQGFAMDAFLEVVGPESRTPIGPESIEPGDNFRPGVLGGMTRTALGPVVGTPVPWGR